MKWIRFLRQYGPIARNDNMYDETIQRAARRAGVDPIDFRHPALEGVATSFDKTTADPISVILTGTAGDGKTHLCRQVWTLLDGSPDEWQSDNPHLSLSFAYPKDRKTWPNQEDPNLHRNVTIHFIRDLSAWAPQQGLPWTSEKQDLLTRCSRSFFDPEMDEVFLIAANDGQLVECWRRLPDNEYVQRARQVLEDLLVEDRQQVEGVRLKFFNLSRWNSAELFARALQSFVSHQGWNSCYAEAVEPDGFFGARCPIRHNYELLQQPLVQERLRHLIELCDLNGIHLPIRQILLLLTNAVLGHPYAKDFLMTPRDVAAIVRDGTTAQASLFNNIFGGNLPENRRTSITVFEHLDRFQIGHETSNRVDNILIFGESDEKLNKYFEQLVASDKFYGADEAFYIARQQYVEGGEDEGEGTRKFLELLVSQRRGLFFKIPKDIEHDLRLWELTVFKFAGEFLSDVVRPLEAESQIRRPILSRLVKGMNRIFTGMLMNSDRELYLATSGNYSQSKISRLLVDRVSVDPNKGERVFLGLDEDTRKVVLKVQLSPTQVVTFGMTLVRYEFLSRVATEGALPSSFSKECYEDVLSFKSHLLSAASERSEANGAVESDHHVEVRILSLSEQGLPEERFVEVIS